MHGDIKTETENTPMMLKEPDVENSIKEYEPSFVGNLSRSQENRAERRFSGNKKKDSKSIKLNKITSQNKSRMGSIGVTTLAQVSIREDQSDPFANLNLSDRMSRMQH